MAFQKTHVLPTIFLRKSLGNHRREIWNEFEQADYQALHTFYFILVLATHVGEIATHAGEMPVATYSSTPCMSLQNGWRLFLLYDFR